MTTRRRRRSGEESRPNPSRGTEAGVKDNGAFTLNIQTAGVVKRADVSRQVDDDVTTSTTVGITDTAVVVQTPYEIKDLSQIFECSNVLRQAVEVYLVNIVSYGYRAVQRFPTVDIDEEEKKVLQSWIHDANPDESLAGVARKYLFDYERFGFGFFEVIRDAEGKPSLLRHAKAARTRILKKSSKLMTVKHEVMRGSRRSYITERKRFRKYVQHRPNSRDLVYFKEFGDPRIMDWRTGEYQGESGKRVRIQHQATELIHGKQLSDEAYGIPRWISQLPNVLGSREAEEVNLRFFEDNTVPPMMLLVSGGQITSKSFQQLQEILSSGGLGRERQHQIMLIEAVAKSESIDENGSVRLEVEKLTDTRQSDGLFKEYDESNQAKVQSSYRLPNTLMGKSQDVTFATANVSQFIAETQVFLPERQIHDELLNKKFINSPTGLNLKTVKLEAKGPQITNPAEIVKTLTAANVMGALTPRTAIDALNEALQLSLPQYPEKPAGYDDTDDDAEPAENGYESWMDRPIAIGLRRLQSQGRLRAEQNVTDSSTRETQETGEIQMTEPENGSE